MIDTSTESVAHWTALRAGARTTAQATTRGERSAGCDEASDLADPDYTPSAARRSRAISRRTKGPKRRSRMIIALPEGLEFRPLRRLADLACAVRANPALLGDHGVAAAASPQMLLAQMRVLREQAGALAAHEQPAFRRGIAAALTEPNQASQTARELALEFGHVLVNNKVLPPEALTPAGALLHAVADANMHPSARFAFAERGFTQALRAGNGWSSFTAIEPEFIRRSVALFTIPTASTFERSSLAAVMLRYALTAAAPDVKMLLPGLVRMSLTPARDLTMPPALRAFAAGNAAAVLLQGQALLSGVERDAILDGLIDGICGSDVTVSTRAKLTATLLKLVRLDRLKVNQDQALSIVPAAISLLNDEAVRDVVKLEITRGLLALHARNHAFVPHTAFERVARFALQPPIGAAGRDDGIRHVATVILADPTKVFQADVYALAVRAWFADLAAGAAPRAIRASSILTILHNHPDSIQPDDFRTLLHEMKRVLVRMPQNVAGKNWLYDIVTKLARRQVHTFDPVFSRNYADYVRGIVEDPTIALTEKRDIGTRLLDLCVRNALSMPNEQLRSVLQAIGTEVTAKLGGEISTRTRGPLAAIA